MNNDTRMKIAVGVLVLIVVMVWLNRRTSTSTFTFEPFANMKTPPEVTASFREQTQKIAEELKTELIKARTENKSKEEMIAIADKFSNYSCEMSKAYSRWNIMNSPMGPPVTTQGAPAAGPATRGVNGAPAAGPAQAR
jgi:hypothetical protein